MSEISQRLADLSPAKRKLLEERLKNRTHVTAEPIAIVGMGCRFPRAHNLDQFWEIIRDGLDVTSEIPASRWDVEEFYDPDGVIAGKTSTRWGAFVDEVDQFDPLFFGITPREAGRMDPQQRLLLEVAWQAIENAGIAADTLAGSKTGVFVGIGGTDYSKLPAQLDDYFEHLDAHVGTGNALSIAANRVSYVLDLHGPSVAVDTACSSGLVALHLAVQSLRNRECDAAIAGGVNLILSPEVTIAFSKAKMLSPTGRCSPFDAGANGYVRGEGCALVLVKRLTDALASGDNVLAVLRASAVNQDGRTSGITAPNSQSQQAVIRAALAQAGLTTGQISYIEAHGTGTPLGDPIEFHSLTELFRRRQADEPICNVTSVKANIGHTETVSGMAGLLKVALLMRHGVIPPQLHLQEINPHIKLEGTRLVIPREPVAWTRGETPRIAGVSSFGFGGTNAHIILEEAVSPPAEPQTTSLAERPLHVLTLSAKNDEALRALAGEYLTSLDEHSDAAVADICHAANVGRAHFNYRAAIVTYSREELRGQLAAMRDGSPALGVKLGQVKLAARPKVAMLFTGQGSQYAGMARGLYDAQPVFRQALDECDEILSDYLDESLLRLLFDDTDGALLNETAYTQPSLFAVEYALAMLWRSWGIEPDAVLGHSVGEYVAYVVAGSLSLEDGLRLIAQRARLMQSLPPDGQMVVVFAGEEQVAKAIAPLADRVAIAAANGPENTVISGERAAVEQLVAGFSAAGVGMQPLAVSHAFHSPLMEPMLDDFRAVAEEVVYEQPRVPVISNLTGAASLDAPDADYLARHIRQTVRFAAGIDSLMELGIDLVIEVGPTPSLLGMARRVAPQAECAWLPSLRKGQDDNKIILDTLSAIYVHGAKIDWRAWDQPWPRRRVELPNYPFQRSRQWFDMSNSTRRSFNGTRSRGPALHPLLGSEVPSALETRLFENVFSDRNPRWLVDHQVQGSVIVPAAAFCEMGLAAASIAFGPGAHAVESISIQQAMYVNDKASRITQLVLSPEVGGEASFEIYSADAEGADSAATAKWKMHASGKLRHVNGLAESQPPTGVNPAEFSVRVVDCTDRAEFYRQVAERGLQYGPAFQALTNLNRGATDAWGEIELASEVVRELSSYHLHPALLDGCLQLMAGVVPLQADGSYSPYTYVPIGFERVRILRPLTEKMIGYAVRTGMSPESATPDQVTADVLLLDETGELLAEIVGATVYRLGKSRGGSEAVDPRDWLYEIAWREQALLPSDTSGASKSAQGTWLIFADRQGVADSIAQQLAEQGAYSVLVRPGERYESPSDGRAQIAPLCGDDYRQLIADATGANGQPFRGVIHLWSLDIATPASAEEMLVGTTTCGCGSVLQLVQQLARSRTVGDAKLWLVTRGGQSVSGELADVSAGQSALWGMGRVAAIEHPELQCCLVDLDPRADVVAALGEELLAGSDENQIAFRDDTRFVARLANAPQLVPSADERSGAAAGTVPKAPYQLRLRGTSSFDTLRLETSTRMEPAAGQVEIEVRATGLNFSDVLKAMGLYPGITDKIVPLGIECAGVISAVGPGVERFRVGDEVMGIAPYSFASHTTTAEYALVKKPANISYEEAATIPVVYLTAYYALCRLADLQPGERVLIHAGAGGVGLAAIQIAQHIGAEIFCTAGSDEKRDYLHSLGVQHVLNSRNLDFADEIRELTGRQGIDVVLNSLPGEAIPKSLQLLRAYGRFLEIGKTDIYQNRMLGLAPFQDNLSYFAIDLDRMLRQRPDYIRNLFAELMEFFEGGHYRPLPFTRFAATAIVGAFRYMAQRKNIGKVVVGFEPADTASESLPANNSAIRSDGAYLVTGGTGALGLQLAEWLAARGAGAVVLLSRRPPNETAAKVIARLRDRGLAVAVVQGDVASADSLHTALAQIPADFPPLRGVIHAAGVLDDGVMFDMSLERLERALSPKVAGAWNLHTATLAAPIEQFVMFSSVASLLGSPGQANYAAGNAFLDGLAHHRRSLGKPALSVNWGPWADSGMAAQAGRDAQLADRGMDLLPAEQCFDLLDGLMAHGGKESADGLPRRMPTTIAQAAVMSARWETMLKAGGGRVPPLLAEVASHVAVDEAQGASQVDQQLRDQLMGADTAEREAMLRDYFTEQLATIMGLSTSSLDLDQPLNTLGLDSLMAIELKNNIETRLAVVLPMARFMEGPSVRTLAQQVAESFAGSAQPAVEELGGGEVADRYPLSRGQQALWFLHRLAPQGTAYNISDAVRVHGPLNFVALRTALQGVVDRHASFRTTFIADDGQPYQYIHATWPTEPELEDATTWSDDELARRMAAEVRRPFDLATGPLLRVKVFRRGDEDHQLVFVVHHIVADIWTLVGCSAEFLELYAAACAGTRADLPELKVAYTDFVRWQSDLLASDVGDEQWRYWQEQLAGELPVLQLPTDRPRPPVQTFNGRLAFRWIGEDITGPLKQLGEQQGATLHMLLLAAYQLLLHHYSGQDDILVLVPTSGRTRAGFSPVAGYFVNPVIIRADLAGNPTLHDFIQQACQRMRGALDHQDFPFPTIVERLQPERDASRSPIAQALFVMQKAQIMHDQGLTPFLMGQSGSRLELAGLTFESLALEQWGAQFDVSLAVSEGNGGISIGLQYNTDLFDASTAERLLNHYQQLLAQLVAVSAEARVSEISPLSAAERNCLLVDWNASERQRPTELLVHEQVAQQAAKTPDAVALVCGGATLSYGELNRRANQLAHHLRKLGVGPNSLVGICLGRGLDLMVAIQGVLKAGGAYVPLDPAYPAQRLEQIFRSAQMKIVLTHAALRGPLVEREIPTLCLDAEWDVVSRQPDVDPPAAATPDDLIYVIFTSGSTGIPKGAGVYHRGFANLLHWTTGEFNVTAADRSLVVTSHGFDLTQKGMFAPLVVGGLLHFSTYQAFDPKHIVAEIEREAISLLVCTPSAFYTFVEATGDERLPALRSLREVLLGGEPIDLRRLSRWLRHPSCRAEVVNTYGPTECTDIVGYYRIPQGASVDKPVPLGRPVYNCKLHVLDRQMALAPVGVSGELYIGGACVGAGYVNDSALTAARFVHDPFSADPGARLYRTGDVCRWLPEGQIEFLGRCDSQLKIRGFRIEIGEIETALAGHPAVGQVVVVAREDVPGDKRIVGYVVAATGTELAASELIDYLKPRLPHYMVPAAIVILPAMPLNPHGKLDRKSLPKPDATQCAGTLQVAPQSETERELSDMWQELLHVSPIGIRDNFFDLGGHSLLAVQLLSRIETRFGRELPLSVLLQESTIEHLAAVLDREEQAGHNSPLVHIRPAGTQSPLFCVHPVGGNVLCYQELAQHVGLDQPVYALEAQGLDGHTPPHESMEEMVAAYVAAIQTIQPRGPYRLAGWSSGGVVAYELAGALQRRGELVALLTLVDSRVPALLNIDPEDEVAILLGLADFYGRYVGLQVSVTRDELEPLDTARRVELLADRYRTSSALAGEITPAQIARYLAVAKSNLRIVCGYQPSAYELPLELIVATETAREVGSENVDLGWRAVVDGPLNIQETPGDHVSMLAGENAVALGRLMAARLNS